MGGIIQIGIFGRTNVVKLLLVNFIANQNASVVSETAGTMTGAIFK
jgi:predicted GTPase